VVKLDLFRTRIKGDIIIETAVSLDIPLIPIDCQTHEQLLMPWIIKEDQTKK
jgi:hypothetical protein